MEQPVEPNEIDLPSSQPESAISRRELLRALATGGLAMAVTTLPVQWTPPHTKVNYLPIHAQVSAPPAQYSGVCDSLPGGGDLQITQGAISNISPYLQLIAGLASLHGISTTMTAEVTSATSPTFNPPLPQTAVTDTAGRANFADLNVTGNAGESFFLVFDFATPSGSVHFRCGEFFFGQPPTN